MNLTAANAPASVILTWTNNDAAGVEWVIERATDPDFNGGLTVFDDFYASVSTITDSAVDTDTMYYYRVREQDANGNQSDWSNTASITTPPIAPSDLAATLIGSSVSLAWTETPGNPPPAHLLVERATDAGFTNDLTDVVVDPTASTYLDDTVAQGSTYYYRVLAAGSTSESDWSDVASIFVPLTPPPAPAGLTALAFAPGTGPARVGLTWTENNGASPVTGFTIDRATNADFTTGFASFTAGPTASAYTLAGLRRGRQYYISIQALNATVASPWTTITVGTPQ